MRAALLFALLSGCSLITETDDLSGGARDSGVPATDTTPGGETCDPEACVSDVAVMKLADLAPCSRDTTDKLGCRAKITAACKALDPCCYKGGYGPVDFPNAAEATVLCLHEAPYTAPVTELTMANTKCLSSALGSRECDGAAHTSSKKRGHGTAILQSTSGDNATLIGIDGGSVETATVPWSELTKLDPGCTAAAVESQACTTAVQRHCTTSADLFTAGYGPVSWTATDATVVCFY